MIKNSTLDYLNTISLFKKVFFFFLVLLLSQSVFSQYSTKHYIAAAPWDYSSDANEFVVSSASGTASVTITKSDGTAITILSVTSGTPVAFRPTGAPASRPANAVNTIYNDRGLIFTSTSPIAVSVRNVESDAVNGGRPTEIKGNSSLSSYGNEAIGSSFRVGYYRSNFTGLYAYAPSGFPAAAAAPVYSVMAIDNNTVVSVNGTVLVTLNAGQSYLFQTAIGSLVTASKPVVMNSGQWRDTPSGCGDSVLNQIPPVRVLGTNYLVVRGNGTSGTATNLSEQTIFIATEDNTTVTVSTVNPSGVVTATNTYTLATAGSFQNIFHGINGVQYSASVISSDKKIMVYSGTADGCEVDMACVAPVSSCTGSFRVETKKFTRYNNTNIKYFGYVLINSSTEKVFMNSTDLETIAGTRRQIGTTGFYLIDFTNIQLSDPTDIIFTSAVRMSISMVQQGDGYSMASYLSSYNDNSTQQNPPTLNGAGCVTALTAEPGLAPYQWYLNDVLIPGATSQTYVPTETGSYSVAGTKACGLSVASTPYQVNCIPIDAVNDGSLASPFATVISGSTLATSVKANDLLDGIAVTSSNTTVTPKTQGPLTINAAGIITVASGTVNGVYPIEYELCSTGLNPTICDKATAYVRVTVLPGSIAANQTICSGGNPTAFTSTASATGVGTITYRWESAVSPFSTWTAISGATSETYDVPVGLNVTTRYRRIAITTLGESDPTAFVTVTVTPLNTIAAGSNQTVCINSPITNITLATTGATGATFSGLPTGVSGAWSGNVVTISGIPSVSGTFNYTVNTTGGCTPATTSGTINVTAAPVAGTLSGTQNVCVGLTTTFTSTQTGGSWSSLNTAIATVNSSTGVVTGVAAGTATIRYTVTGTGGCADVTANLDVIVGDTTAPVVPTLADVTGQCSVTPTAPTTTDACSGTITGTTSTVFPITTQGTTVVTWSFDDGNGQVVTANLYFIVVDTTVPVVPTLADVTGQCSVTPTAPTTTDACSGTITGTTSTVFPITTQGTTVVTWSFDDGNGQVVTANQNIILGPLPSAPQVDVVVAQCNILGTVKITNYDSSSLYSFIPSGPIVGVDGTVIGVVNGVSYEVLVINSNNCNSLPTTFSQTSFICANDDTIASTGGNVLSNDTLNGAAVTTTNTDVTPVTSGPLSIDANGTLTVAPNTPSGTYTITYELCEVGATPANCDTAIATVVINTIDAVDDGLQQVISLFGKTINSVLLNDTFNGVLLTPATYNTVSLSGVTVPTGFTLNSDGSIDVAPGTPIGTYTIVYEICTKSTPVLCDQATVVIEIQNLPPPAPPIVFADNDTVGSIDGSNGAKNVISILSNDFIDLTPATINNVNISIITPDATGSLVLNPDGSVDVKAGTPAGTYTFVYEICTKNTPVVCDQATVTVTVICNTTKISGVVRDLLNNKPLANVPVTLIPDKQTTGPVLLMLTKADGSYNFTGFTPGDYIIQVQDVNLNSAQNLYNVGPSIQFLNIQNCIYEVRNFDYDKTDLPVLGNFVWYDINSNGLQDEWYDANNDGVVTQNIPDANGYIDYSKWEWIDYNGDGSYQGKINEGEINAAGLGNGTTDVPNIYITGPNGFSRQITMSIQGYWRTRAPQGNWGDYQVNLVMESNLEAAAQAKAATGLIKVLSEPLDRFITDKNSTTQSFIVCGVTNNSTKNTQLSVAKPVDDKLDFGIQCKLFATIVANNDLVGPIVSSTTATTNVVSVLANDTFNGNPLVLADVNLTVVNANPNLRLNADGSVDVLANTAAGTYVLVYQICEKTNPANCKTATVTVTVVAPVIVATNDDYSNQPIDSSKGTVLDILANDRLNNGTVSAPQVVITIVDANGIAGVTVDAQGKVTIPTGTPVGTYIITYRICDVVNPNNCATATITIVVKDPCDFDDSASSCDILIHNAFSPNNDGRNEEFLIERIENYPENTVEIYNRWGVLVFEVSGYDNDSKVFVGLSEGRVTVNKADALPNGTYYYVVKYKKPISGVMNQKAGFLYLSR